ncbi:UPF0271 [Fusarium agapanthi]|uniref:20S-pre-rRNA D-site endonuclease NOB1 n=1 Tax=Fusarium agapanthi TaxID=1803897 RepID=A0A9P5E8W1_9HYPO|nr:UPF0271 [Fusarium agapanthi]
MSSDAAAHKPIHSLALDTGPLIKNDPPANTLRAKAEQLYTLPCIISEIRDAATRARVETTLLPFITLRSPNPESVKVIRDFARRTGDLAVLSKPDIDVLALGYELECERNGGDWRLRKTPGQKGLNGKPNKPAEGEKTETETETDKVEETLEKAVDNLTIENPVEQAGESSQSTEAKDTATETVAEPESKDGSSTDVTETATNTTEDAATAETAQAGEKADETIEAVEEASDGDASDDEGGWITPSNLKKHQAADTGATPSAPVQKTLQAAVLTSDYAMQNVALRMNLNLVAPSLARITHLKNWVLRCHGCFKITKEMNKQFCPSCGQPTLNRVSCSTDEHGNFKIHLKKNFQWNNRGNVYSVPKPVHGSANGRLPKNAGGKNGWGNNLILAEDQKEFTRAGEEQRRQRKKDIMDQDYLPDLLTGHRAGGGQKIRVGAGRNVNSKKKH